MTQNLETHEPETDYLFDTGSELGHSHMQNLEQVFDGPTFEMLDAIDLAKGQRCLDLGAGGGSVTRWLADRVGRSGEVIAVDLDTTHLADGRGVRAHRRDINDGLTGPVAGPYDLIHARLTLLHLPRREEIFAELVEALAPGGWIVIGDLAATPPLRVLAAPDPVDIDVWKRIQYLSHEVVGPQAGMDFDWADQIHDRMVHHDLLHIEGVDQSITVAGGTPGAMLHSVTNLQASEALLAAGAEEWEMQRYQELTHDPAFRTWFYRFVCLRGQRAH